jgi:hypothetical protein
MRVQAENGRGIGMQESNIFDMLMQANIQVVKRHLNSLGLNKLENGFRE